MDSVTVWAFICETPSIAINKTNILFIMTSIVFYNKKRAPNSYYLWSRPTKYFCLLQFSNAF